MKQNSATAAKQQIQGRTLRGSEVTITVSPRGAQVTPAAGPATGAPAREPK